jgi:hypothetical protein
MRKAPVLALALMSAFMIPAIQQLYAASQEIDGVVTDSMCGKKRMMPRKTDAQLRRFRELIRVCFPEVTHLTCNQACN